MSALEFASNLAGKHVRYNLKYNLATSVPEMGYEKANCGPRFYWVPYLLVSWDYQALNESFLTIGVFSNEFYFPSQITANLNFLLERSLSLDFWYSQKINWHKHFTFKNVTTIFFLFKCLLYFKTWIFQISFLKLTF